MFYVCVYALGGRSIDGRWMDDPRLTDTYRDDGFIAILCGCCGRHGAVLGVGWLAWSERGSWVDKEGRNTRVHCLALSIADGFSGDRDGRSSTKLCPNFRAPGPRYAHAAGQICTPFGSSSIESVDLDIEPVETPGRPIRGLDQNNV